MCSGISNVDSEPSEYCAEAMWGEPDAATAEELSVSGDID